jgi:hypothetical protein
VEKSGIGILPVNKYEAEKHRLEAYAAFGDNPKNQLGQTTRALAISLENSCPVIGTNAEGDRGSQKQF